MEVVGGFSLKRKGSFHTPQSVAIIDDKTVTIHTLSTPFHYYFLPGVTGSGGLVFGGAVGLLVGVAVGIGLTLYLQNWRYSKAINNIRRGEVDIKPEVVAKKGKVREIEVEEGRFGSSVRVVTPRTEFTLTGDEEDVERVYDALV